MPKIKEYSQRNGQNFFIQFMHEGQLMTYINRISEIRNVKEQAAIREYLSAAFQRALEIAIEDEDEYLMEGIYDFDPEAGVGRILGLPGSFQTRRY